MQLVVYYLLGQEVITLVDRTHQAGNFEVVWHGKDSFGRHVPSGVYVYRLEAEGYTASKKMLLLR